jgi:uncharacterized protein (DUF2141 family)
MGKNIKNILLLTILIFICALSLKSQVSIKIVISDLNTSKGQIMLDFKDGNDKTIKGFTQEITNKKCVFTINNLKPGKYSFKYFHDENNNKILDTYLIGAPKEGYGFYFRTFNFTNITKNYMIINIFFIRFNSV